MKVRDIRHEDIARTVNTLQTKDGLSVASANLVLSVLSAAFNDAVRHNLARANPCSHLGTDRPGAGTEKDTETTDSVKIMTPDELRAFLAAAPEPWSLFWQLLAQTGLRPSEALGLRRQDIDLEAGTLSVNGQLSENREWTSRLKTKKSKRVLPLPASLRTKLERQLRWFSASDTFVFTTLEGLPWTQREVSRNFRVTAEKIGLTGLTAKGLRHYFGSYLLEHGIPLATVSARMGHANVSITATVYMHELDKLANDDTLRALLEAVGS
jgi:integrase